MAVKLLQQMMLVMLLLIKQEAFAQNSSSITKPGCQERCGSVVLSYPFGIGENCSADETMLISCDNSYNPPKPFLKDAYNNDLEVLNISLEAGTIRINYPITTDCTNTSDHDGEAVYLPDFFTFSETENRFTAMGCDNFALLRTAAGFSQPEFLVGGCVSVCSDLQKTNNCFGIDCCQIRFPPTLQYIRTSVNSTLLDKAFEICDHGPRYKDGWLLVADFNCVKIEVDHSVKKAAITVIATCAGLGVLLATTWWLYKERRRRKIRKLEEKFFKRNGGLLLRQQVSSSEGKVETTKLFTSKELESATDHYNIDRIVGQGGLGTVYKGMLTDGRIVAVKKSKIEDESKLEHFINEVVILSQINHRNIVKLHGCCLETEVPLLVYEFIPNGTLMQYIHEHNEYFPLTWDVRLRVATEVAGALYYLHSAASIPIYHRDIKSSNILLDDKHTAKVADFGTSRSVSIDKTHLTTRVQGTFGYLDPEYFQSSQITDKSDVYSFGVVLVELLTGQKPILPARLDDESRSLATLFILAVEENRILDILDPRITNEGKKEEMLAFANIAYRCLKLNGRKRPAIKQVVAELESIRNTNGSPTAQQHDEEVEFGIYELNESWESDVTSTSMSSTVYHSLTVDIEPLMTN